MRESGGSRTLNTNCKGDAIETGEGRRAYGGELRAPRRPQHGELVTGRPWSLDERSGGGEDDQDRRVRTLFFFFFWWSHVMG